MQIPAHLFVIGLATTLVSTACGESSNEGGSGGDAGTGGSGNAAGSGNAGGGSSGSGGGGNTGGESFSVDIGPINVGPGEEHTRCVIKRLGNPTEFRVGRVDNHISSSSHHMIVYRTSDTKEVLEPFNCSPFVETLDPTKGSPLMITQKYDDALQLPEGVAYTFEPNQMIRLELHYLNTTPKAVDVSASSTFTSIPEGSFQYEAGFLFTGNVDIDIPAQSSATLGPVWFPLPSELGGTKLFAITGHEHRFGTNVYVELAANESAPATPVYDVPDFKWDEPETVVHSPPKELPAGSGFRFTCEWNNTSKSSVGFGESANREMCFFWAYYYPSQGSRVCFHTDQLGFPINDCCPGGQYCQFLGF